MDWQWAPYHNGLESQYLSQIYLLWLLYIWHFRSSNIALHGEYSKASIGKVESCGGDPQKSHLSLLALSYAETI